MKSSTKKLLLISIICIIVGFAIVFICSLFGVNTSVCWDRDNHKFIFGKDEKEVVMSKTKIDDFSSIDINLDRAKINFIPDDDYYIEYKLYLINDNPSIYVKGNTLHASDTDNVFILNFNFLDWKDFSKDSYVNIYYPKDKAFDKVKLDSDMSGATISGLVCNKLDCNLDMGSMTLENCSVIDYSTFDLDMGSLDIISSEFGKSEIDLDMGSFTITDSVFDSVDADLDMGDFEATNSAFNRIDGDLDMGSVDLSLESNVKSKKDKNVIYGKNYGFELETDMGSIDVDGNSQGDEYNLQGDNMIVFSCDMGSIDIKVKNMK